MTRDVFTRTYVIVFAMPLYYFKKVLLTRLFLNYMFI